MEILPSDEYVQARGSVGFFLRAGFVSEEIKEIERATRENPDAIQTSVIPIIAS